MGNRYLVVSDLHIADIEDHDDGWMSHKGSEYVFDESFDTLVHQFMEDSEAGDKLTLVLNGDIFDFDLVTATPEDPPWPVNRAERKRGMHATAEKSAWKLEYILEDHPRFIGTLARFIAGGHRLVYVMGNHDREFHFPEVQRVLTDAIETSARDDSLSLLRGTISFEPWFFYVAGEIYVEHGQQYDFYNSFRYLLWPVVKVKKQEAIALPMGNVSNRYLTNRMGYFNPHSADFILNIFSYVLHWLKFYALTRRLLFPIWFVGSIAVIFRMLKVRKKLQVVPPDHLKRMDKVARRYDLSSEEIQALGQLQRRPITSRMYRLVRELWIDRLLIAILMTGGTITLALVPIPLWIKLMVPLSGFPLLYLIYEWLAQGETIFTMEKAIPQRARVISRVLPAKVIALGHTHKPRQFPISKGVSFVDTGTWAPMTDREDRTRLVKGLKNYLLVTIHQQEVTVKFDSWMK